MIVVAAPCAVVVAQARRLSPAATRGRRSTVLVPPALALLVGACAASGWTAPAGSSSMVVDQTSLPVERLVGVVAALAATSIAAWPSAVRCLAHLHGVVRRHGTDPWTPAVAVGAQLGYLAAVGALLTVPVLAAGFSGATRASMSVSLGVACACCLGAVTLAGLVLATAGGSRPFIALGGATFALARAGSGHRVTLDTIGAPPVLTALTASALLSLVIAGRRSRRWNHQLGRGRAPRRPWRGRHIASVVLLELRRTAVRPGASRSTVLQCAGLTAAAALTTRFAPRGTTDDVLPLLVLISTSVWSHVALTSWIRYHQFPHLHRFLARGDRWAAPSIAATTTCCAIVPVAFLLYEIASRSGSVDGVLVGMGVLTASIGVAIALGGSPTLAPRLEGAETLLTMAVFLAVAAATRGIGAAVGDAQAPWTMGVLGSLVLVASIVPNERRPGRPAQPRRVTAGAAP